MRAQRGGPPQQDEQERGKHNEQHVYDFAANPEVLGELGTRELPVSPQFVHWMHSRAGTPDRRRDARTQHAKEVVAAVGDVAAYRLEPHLQANGMLVSDEQSVAARDQLLAQRGEPGPNRIDAAQNLERCPSIARNRGALRPECRRSVEPVEESATTLCSMRPSSDVEPLTARRRSRRDTSSARSSTYRKRVTGSLDAMTASK